MISNLITNYNALAPALKEQFKQLLKNKTLKDSQGIPTD